MSVIAFFLLMFLNISSQIKVGEKPPVVVLSGNDGGKVSGEPFSTEELQGKVFFVVYVDPDYRDLNEDFNEKLRARHYPDAVFGSVAITNMAATWLPNIILKNAIAEKQKKYPRAVFVLDYNKVFVKKWGLADDNYNTIIIGKDGRVLFYKVGKLTDDDQAKIFEILDRETSK